MLLFLVLLILIDYLFSFLKISSVRSQTIYQCSTRGKQYFRNDDLFSRFIWNVFSYLLLHNIRMVILKLISYCFRPVNELLSHFTRVPVPFSNQLYSDYNNFNVSILFHDFKVLIWNLKFFIPFVHKAKWFILGSSSSFYSNTLWPKYSRTSLWP